MPTQSSFTKTVRSRWLTDEELQRLLESLNDHPDQNITNAVRLLLFTGSRKIEVLQATWDQFDLEKGLWIKPPHMTKTRTLTFLPLSVETVEFLKKMKELSSSPFLFPGNILGKPLQEIRKSWSEIRTRANLPDIRIRDLRETYGTHLLLSGLNLGIIAELLGDPFGLKPILPRTEKSLRQATQVFANKVRDLTTAAEASI